MSLYTKIASDAQWVHPDPISQINIKGQCCLSASQSCTKRYLLSAGGGFSDLLLVLDGSNVGVSEANGDSFSILHENTLSRRHSSVLKVGIRLRRLLHVQLLLSV